MNKIKNLIGVVGVLAMLASCDTDKDVALFADDSQGIRINAYIGAPYTRSNPVGTDNEQKQFNKGDQVALSCEDGSVVYQLNDGKWELTDNYYLRWGAEPVTYSAWHPVSNSTTVTNFAMPVNQKTIENIASADYMTCVLKDAAPDENGMLQLPMQRKMAKVIFTLKGVAEGYRVQNVRIGSYTGYVAGTVAETTTRVLPYVTVPQGVKSGQNGTQYTAVVTPGEADDNAEFIVLNYRGEEYVISGMPSMQPGKEYRYELQIEGMRVSLSAPTVNDWTEGTVTTPSGAFEERLLFVKTQKTGTGDGLTWENAMGAQELRALLETKDNNQMDADNLDGQCFYLAGGTYILGNGAGEKVKIEYSGYKKQVEITIQGGYNPESTGRNLNDRNTTEYQTIFSGDLNDNNQTDDNNDCGLFLLGNQVNLKINGCTFMYLCSNAGGAIQVAHGNSGRAVLELNDCYFKKNRSTGNGGVITLSPGVAKLNHVQFVENSCKGRRAVFHIEDSRSHAFINNSSFFANACGDWWGGTINFGSGLPYIYIHNTTFADNTTSTDLFHGSVSGFLVNSTFVGVGSGSSYGMLRPGNGSELNIMNCIVLHKNNHPAFQSDNGGRIKSDGYNIIGNKIESNNYVTSEKDLYDQQWDASKLTWDADNGVYTWDGSWSGFNEKTSVAAIRQALANGGDLSKEFLQWIGEESLSTDQLGNVRDVNALWPGAYQK